MEPSEEVLAELEALTFTYGDELDRTDGLEQFSMIIRPYTADGSQQFVECRLSLHVPPSYPAEGPSIAICDVKGMSEERVQNLWNDLAAAAADLAGELVLGHLIENARDALTDFNSSPEGMFLLSASEERQQQLLKTWICSFAGSCCFCLEPLLDEQQGTQDIDQLLMRLPCYHAYHRCKHIMKTQLLHEHVAEECWF